MLESPTKDMINRAENNQLLHIKDDRSETVYKYNGQTQVIKVAVFEPDYDLIC